MGIYRNKTEGQKYTFSLDARLLQKLGLLLFVLFGSMAGFSQSEMSAFTATGRAGAASTFVTDYQAMGINPSNLGWAPKDDKIISFGLLEGAYSFYSEALIKSELIGSLKKGNTDFTYDEKISAAQDFTESGLAANFDVTWIALGVQPKKELGGFAFGIRERFQWYSKFSEIMSEILFRGYNAPYFTNLILTTGDTIINSANLPQDTLELIEKGINLLPKLFSEILGESELSMSWYREYNFSYGRILLGNENMALYGGVGFKYLSGMAIMDAKVEGGELEAFSAITPALEIEYGDSAKANNPSSVEDEGLLPKSIGSGMGIDLGVSIVLGEKLKIGLAINDIGSITWDGNVYQAGDETLIDLASPGFNSYNLVEQAQEILGDSGLFKWNGVVEKKISLPTHLRAGASFKASDKFEVGFDIVIPANTVAGNYEKSLIAIGFDIIPIPWLRLSSGLSTGGNYGYNLPLGVVLMLSEGAWEIGVASRDAFTFFNETRPNLSLSTGFLRFRF